MCGDKFDVPEGGDIGTSPIGDRMSLMPFVPVPIRPDLNLPVLPIGMITGWASERRCADISAGPIIVVVVFWRIEALLVRWWLIRTIGVIPVGIPTALSPGWGCNKNRYGENDVLHRSFSFVSSARIAAARSSELKPISV